MRKYLADAKWVGLIPVVRTIELVSFKPVHHDLFNKCLCTLVPPEIQHIQDPLSILTLNKVIHSLTVAGFLSGYL